MRTQTATPRELFLQRRKAWLKEPHSEFHVPVMVAPFEMKTVVFKVQPGLVRGRRAYRFLHDCKVVGWGFAR